MLWLIAGLVALIAYGLDRFDIRHQRKGKDDG